MYNDWQQKRLKIIIFIVFLIKTKELDRRNLFEEGQPKELTYRL